MGDVGIQAIPALSMVLAVIGGGKAETGVPEPKSGADEVRVTIEDMVKAGDRGGLVVISGRGVLPYIIILEVGMGMAGGSRLRVKGKGSAQATNNHVLPIHQLGGRVQVLPGQVVKTEDPMKAGHNGFVGGHHIDKWGLVG